MKQKEEKQKKVKVEGKESRDIKFNVLAIIAIVIFCFALTPKTLQNDTFYTIKIGELITQNGIDGKDHFSWHEDLPYTYPHWAYDVGIYEIYQVGNQAGNWLKSVSFGNETIQNNIQNTDFGMLAIYISTIILASILGILIYSVAKKLSKNNVISFFLTLGAMYLLKDFIAARAQLVSFILFALTILWIEAFLETKKKRYLVGLVAISLALANLHVAVWPFFFVLFLPYVAEYIIALLADAHILSHLSIWYYQLKGKFVKEDQKAKQEQKRQEKQEKLLRVKEGTTKLREHPYRIKITKNKAVIWLVIVMILCALTGLLTPLGDTPYTYLIKTMQGNTTQSISEHLPLTLFNDKATMVVLVVFLSILIFTDTKIKLSDLFMLAGLTYLMFMSRRQVSLLVIMGSFILAKLLANLAQKYAEKGSEKLEKAMVTIIGKVLTLAIVLLIAISFYKPKMNNPFISKSSYPVEAADYILENIDIATMKLYNEYNYGSYLLFRGIPVFIDSRADLYAPEFNGTKGVDGTYEGRDIFSDYINISSIGTYYEDKFETYGITHVMCVKNAKLNMFISRDKEHYKELYSDDYFVIYERILEG